MPQVPPKWRQHPKPFLRIYSVPGREAGVDDTSSQNAAAIADSSAGFLEAGMKQRYQMDTIQLDATMSYQLYGTSAIKLNIEKIVTMDRALNIRHVWRE